MKNAAAVSCLVSRFLHPYFLFPLTIDYIVYSAPVSLLVFFGSMAILDLMSRAHLVKTNVICIPNYITNLTTKREKDNKEKF